jgi:hypothetical protein
LIITLTMFLIGILLGFNGAGGAGFIIALLTVIFGVSIHTALHLGYVPGFMLFYITLIMDKLKYKGDYKNTQ